MAVVDVPQLEEPGNFVIVIGDEDAKRGLRGAQGKVNEWLVELSDDLAFFAAGRLATHAPGNIHELVDVSLATELDPGVIEAGAGVTRARGIGDPNRGRDSNPQDYPVFVDQGTGIYGERRSPIYATPGTLMGPIEWMGRDIFIHSFKGQIAQHFSDRAFEDTVRYTPERIELSKAALEARILSRT